MYTNNNISLEDLVQYKNFYQRHGIQVVSQLLTLKDNSLESFFIPINSTIHFAVRDTGDIGILEDDELLTNAGSRVLVDYVSTYQGTTIGRPISLNKQTRKIITQTINRIKRFKYLPFNESLASNASIPKIINYGLIDECYKYAGTTGIDYIRRYNYFNTIISNVVKELTDTQRNQFIYVDTPSKIPSLSRLESAEKELYKNIDTKTVPLDTRLLTVFGSDGKFFLLQLWLWAGEYRKLSILSSIPTDQLSRVNFLTSLDGKYSVLNLGKFNEWIKQEGHPKATLSPVQAQKVILRHYMTLQQIRSVSDDTVLVDEESRVDRDQLDSKIDGGELQEVLDNDREYHTGEVAPAKQKVDIDTSKIKAKQGKTLNIKPKMQEVNAVDENYDKMSDDEQFLMDQMDRDLQQLETTSMQDDVDNITVSENVYQPYKPKPLMLENNINDTAQKLHEQGLLSAAEVRRMSALAERYKTIKSPYDPTQTIEAFKNISIEELKIPDKVPLTKKTLRGITDPSVMNWSMKDFNKRYIKEVLPKDVINAIMHVQHGGVAVTDMDISEEHTLLGSKQILSVQLTPVYGKPKTVKIPLPIINEDGIFQANKVKYRLKTQRVDKRKPISMT